MDRFLIAESYDSKNSALKLVDLAPEAIPIISLFLYFYRIFNDLNTPLFVDIRPFSKHLIDKIISILIIHYLLTPGC